MKTLVKLIMTVVACITALATFAYFVDSYAKEKRYIVLNDETNEIY